MTEWSLNDVERGSIVFAIHMLASALGSDDVRQVELAMTQLSAIFSDRMVGPPSDD